MPASEPTDLIRDVDAALDGITPGPWELVDDWALVASGPDSVLHGYYEGECSCCGDKIVTDASVVISEADLKLFVVAPDLVRRLRDALEAELCSTCGGVGIQGTPPDNYYDCPECVSEPRRIERERDEARDALAEANATIAALREREETAGHIAEVERFRAIEATRQLVEANATIARLRAREDAVAEASYRTGQLDAQEEQP